MPDAPKHYPMNSPTNVSQASESEINASRIVSGVENGESSHAGGRTKAELIEELRIRMAQQDADIEAISVRLAKCRQAEMEPEERRSKRAEIIQGLSRPLRNPAETLELLNALKNERHKLRAQMDARKLEIAAFKLATEDPAPTLQPSQREVVDSQSAIQTKTAVDHFGKTYRATQRLTDEIQILNDNIKDLEEDNEHLVGEMVRTELDWEEHAKKLEDENEALKLKLLAAENRNEALNWEADGWVDIEDAAEAADEATVKNATEVADQTTLQADVNRAKATNILGGVTRMLWRR
jgi:hypothetical protein